MPRYTIRELMLCTVVVGIGAAWWADRQLLGRQIVAEYRRGKQLTVEHAKLTRTNIGAGGMSELPRGYYFELGLGIEIVLPFPAAEKRGPLPADE